MNTDLYFKQLEETHAHTRTLCQQAEQVLVQSPAQWQPEQASLLHEILNQLTLSIEELQVAEEELREQATQLETVNRDLEVERLRYQQLFESAPDGYFITDLYGVIQEANFKAAQLLGVRADYMVGKLLATFIPAAERPTFRAILNKLKTLDQTLTWEGRLQPRTSPALEVEFTVGPAFDPAATLVALRWLVRDISIRKQVESEIQHSQSQLKALTSYIHQAREEERRRISREIHDQLGGDLTALKIEFSGLEQFLPSSNPDLTQRMCRITELIDNNIQTVRQVAAELRPAILDDLGLMPALEWQLTEFQRGTGLTCRLNTNLEEISLTSERATAVFRLFQEALTNIARHAQATEVEVDLNQEADTLRLEIRDNGSGITPEATNSKNSWGLIGMRERAALLAGQVNIQGAPNAGTTVVIQMPIHEAKQPSRPAGP